METSKPSYKERQKHMKQHNDFIDKCIDNKDLIEKIINYIYGEKYAHPRDENERGFNRGMDMAMKIIDTNFIY